MMAEETRPLSGSKDNLEAARIKAFAALGVKAIDTTGGIMIEFLRASSINPVLTPVAIIIAASVLHKAGVIDDKEKLVIDGFVLVITSAEVATGLLKQTVTTVAQGTDAALNTAALFALLPK